MTDTVKERPILFSGPMIRAILAGTKTQTRRIVKGPNADIVNDYELRGLQDYPDGTTRAVFDHHTEEPFSVRCPYGKPGDRLWVKETWGLFDRTSFGGAEGYGVAWRATHPGLEDGVEWIDGPDDWGYPQAPASPSLVPRDTWRPSIHMPRWASRLTLEVTDRRVERLHDISEEDAIAEGVERPVVDGHVLGWENYLWHGNRDAPQKYRDAWEWQYSTYGADRENAARLSFSSLWASINGPESWAANPWVWVVSFRRVER